MGLRLSLKKVQGAAETGARERQDYQRGCRRKERLVWLLLRWVEEVFCIRITSLCKPHAEGVYFTKTKQKQKKFTFSLSH